MKLSVMSYTLARQGWKKNGAFDLKGMGELARSLEIDGVDMVTDYGLEAAEIRRVLDDYGLDVVCYTFSGAGLNAETAAERCAGVDAVKEGLDTAAALGTDTVMLITPGKPGVPRDVSRRRYIRGLQESAALARQAGIRPTLENFPGADSPFVISSDVLEAVREVPGLKLTFDNGNVLLGGEDPAASFARCAAHVIHAHFKDWVRAAPGAGMEALDGRRYTPALIGEGVVDQKACLAAMQSAGYGGHINIEYEGNQYLPDDATRRAARCLRERMVALEGGAP